MLSIIDMTRNIIRKLYNKVNKINLNIGSEGINFHFIVYLVK